MVVTYLKPYLESALNANFLVFVTCMSPSLYASNYLHYVDAPALISRLLDKLMKSDVYSESHGAAFAPTV